MLILARLLVGLLALGTIGFMTAFLGAMGVAVLESRPLDSVAMKSSAEAKAYAEAEKAALASVNLTTTASDVGIHQPVAHAHAFEAGKGEPVLFLPGDGAAATYAPLLGELRKYHVFAVDRPAQGLTDGIDYQAADLRRLSVTFIHNMLKALGIGRVVLVGSGIGGDFAIWYALAHPDRVAGVILLGTPAGALDTGAPEPIRRLAVDGQGPILSLLSPSHKSAEAARKYWTPLLGAHAVDHITPQVRETLMAADAMPGSRRSQRIFWRDLLAKKTTGITADELSNLKPPLLWVWGDADAYADTGFVGRAKLAAPAAEWRILAGAGQAPWLDDAAAVAVPIATFLDRVQPAPPPVAQVAAKPASKHHASHGEPALGAVPDVEEEQPSLGLPEPKPEAKPEPKAAAKPTKPKGPVDEDE